MSFSSKKPAPVPPSPPPPAPLKTVSVNKGSETNIMTGKKTQAVDLKKLQIPLIQSGTTSGLNVPTK